MREKIFSALRELPGLEPEASYPKDRRVSLYGGMRVIYKPGELPPERFAEALRAEGVQVRLGFHYRVLTLPCYIEPEEEFLEQFIGAFRKVVRNYKALM